MRKNQQKPNFSGIELGAPRLTCASSSAAAGLLLGTVLTLLAVFGAEWCFLSLFAPPVFPLTVVLYTLLFVLVLSAGNLLKRARPVLQLLLLLAYAWTGYLLRKELIQGFLIITNRIMITYAGHSSYVFPIYDVSAKSGDYTWFCTAFFVYAAFFLCLFLSWSIIRQQNFLLTFLATVPFPVAGLIFNIAPDFRAALALVACWTILLLMRIPGGGAQGFLKRRGAYRAVRPATASRTGLRLLPAVALCFALILFAFPRQSYRYSGQAEKLRGALTDAVSGFSLFDGGDTLAGSSDHVNLKGSDSVRFTGKTMLLVQATVPHPAYLKGFTGSVYTGNSWEPLSDSDYQQVGAQLGGLNVQNFSSKFLSLAGNSQIDPGGYGIHVKNVGANKRLIYAPYNLTTTPQDITGVKFIQDSVLRSDWIFGTGEYSLYANSFNGSRIISSVPGVVASLYRTAQVNGAAQRRTLEQEVLSFLNGYPDDRFTGNENIRDFYLGSGRQEVPQNFDSARKGFLEAEQAYRLFLYDRYTQLPQEIADRVRTLEAENGIAGDRLYGGNGVRSSISFRQASVEVLANEVRQYLADHCSYTLTPGKVPAGRDFTEYFLFENRKGYCVHFATAAAVMLRAMGVPARYAEGYIVTADDYNSATGGWANIRDSRAHAWVEIYYPGIGWQPFEMTPGFNVQENRTQDNEAPSSSSSAPASSAPESSAPSSAESKVSSGSASAGSSRAAVPPPTTRADDFRAAMRPVLFFLAAAALLMAAAVLRRRLAIRRRERLFSQPDRNRAALAVYRHLVRLTQFGGEIPERITDIALKARFSQHTVGEEELKALRNYAEQLTRRNLFNASNAEEILIKYVYALA